MRTIDDKLIEVNYRPSGFDYLRIFLSCAVIAWHGLTTSYGPSSELIFWNGPARPIAYFIVPSFFALSGFLVSGSLERNNLLAFLALRTMRIFPSLVVEVLLSAFIIGPIFTTLDLYAYFSDPVFFAYLKNMLGIVHFNLPGVFANLPAPTVNRQLWTVPWELKCYIAISALALFGLYKREATLALSFFAISIYAFLSAPNLDVIFLLPTGTILVLCFLGGVVLYRMRKTIPYNYTLLSLSLVGAVTSVFFDRYIYLAAFPIAYVTMFVGLLDPKRLFFIKGADFSYGMYLYGFPIQQVYASLFPAYRIWALNVAFSLVVSAFFAYLSWTYIEAPVMARKKRALLPVNKFAGWLEDRLKAISGFYLGHTAK